MKLYIRSCILIFKDNFPEDSDTFIQLSTRYNISSNYQSRSCICS